MTTSALLKEEAILNEPRTDTDPRGNGLRRSRLSFTNSVFQLALSTPLAISSTIVAQASAREGTNP